MRKKKIIIPAILFMIIVILSACQIRQVNSEYELEIETVGIGEPIYFQNYKVLVNAAEIFGLEEYYEQFPEVRGFKEQNQHSFQYVLLTYLEITKIEDRESLLDLTNFVLRMGYSFNMIDTAELTVLNGWKEEQVLEPGVSFYIMIPYYISSSMFTESQWEALDQMDFRITWGVYPRRNEIQLEQIDNWDTVMTAHEYGNLDTETGKDESDLTGAEAYAKKMKELGLTADNMRKPGEAASYNGVTYEIINVSQLYNVSEIPDYTKEYLIYPNSIDESGNFVDYTEESDYRGDFIRKHCFLLLEVVMTNHTDKETIDNFGGYRLVYENKELLEEGLLFSTEVEYFSSGIITIDKGYGESTGFYTVLQPGESVKKYVLYEIYMDIDTTGTNHRTKDGMLTYFVSEEDADLKEYVPLYFMLGSSMGQALDFSNKGFIFMELDWGEE